MTTPTKRSAKARLLYCVPSTFENRQHFTDHLVLRNDAPYFVLPASLDDVERMREAVAKASDRYFDSINRDHEAFSEAAHANAILTALGLTPAKKTKAL